MALTSNKANLVIVENLVSEVPCSSLFCVPRLALEETRLSITEIRSQGRQPEARGKGRICVWDASKDFWKKDLIESLFSETRQNDALQRFV